MSPEDELTRNPPWAATALVGAVAQTADRDAILGDLQEEFFLKFKEGSLNPRLWYWTQTAKALVFLSSRRMTSAGLNDVLTATFLSVAAIVVWAFTVSYSATLAISGAFPDLSTTSLYAFYICIQILGDMGITALVALAAFRTSLSFRLNFLSRMIPPLCIVILLKIIQLQDPSAPIYPHIIGFCLGVPAVVFGTWIGYRLKHRLAGAHENTGPR